MGKSRMKTVAFLLWNRLPERLKKYPRNHKEFICSLGSKIGLWEADRDNLNIPLLSDNDPMKQEHLHRYVNAKSFVYGYVIDVACGWGYGSEILSYNAAKVLGLDIDEEAISYAQENYPTVEFRHCDIETAELEKVDCIVTIETVEHLKEPLNFINKIQEAANQIFITTPIVPSKTFNQYHLHDFTLQQVMCWFLDWDLLYVGFQESPVAPGFYSVMACFRKRPELMHPDVLPSDEAKHHHRADGQLPLEATTEELRHG